MKYYRWISKHIRDFVHTYNSCVNAVLRKAGLSNRTIETLQKQDSSSRSAIFVLTLVAIAIDTMNAFSYIQTNSVYRLLIFVYIFCVVILPFFPEICSVLLITIGTIVPHLSYGIFDMRCTTILAFGIALCCIPEEISLYLPATTIVINIISVIFYHQNIHNVIGTVLLPQIVSCTLGYILRNRKIIIEAEKQRLALENSQKTIAQLQRDIHVASVMHDTLTNQLTNLLLLYNVRLEMARDDQERELLEQSRQECAKALDNAHVIIDMLRNDQNMHEEQIPMQQWYMQIKKSMEKQDAKLKQEGLHGISKIEESLISVQLEHSIYEEIQALVAQLYSNIKRHADPEGSFILRIFLKENKIHIMQMNDVNPHDEDVGSHKGLALHKQLIAMLGGSLEYTIQDNTWQLEAQFPCLKSCSIQK